MSAWATLLCGLGKWRQGWTSTPRRARGGVFEWGPLSQRLLWAAQCGGNRSPQELEAAPPLQTGDTGARCLRSSAVAMESPAPVLLSCGLPG